MQIYLVGGAVRDELLGRPVTERDWVVVGASAEDMLERGFKPVGKDFPVFLHPETKEEYALARTERKTAPGYHGFTFHAAPDVTLEQDLQRRDLTINAMARDDSGELIDPYHGYRDLQARQLRHVSEAFAEDPVRILRLARFAARYAPLGFTVADETMALCRSMVDQGEVDALVPERVWQELHKTFSDDGQPSVFIRVLRDCGALARILPEVDALFGVPQRAEYHPEIDTGEHLCLALDMAPRLSNDPKITFAVLVHDLGKGITPADILPRHIGHEAAGVPLVDEVCERLRVPKAYRSLARAVTRHHIRCHMVMEMNPGKVVKLLEDLDTFRRAEQLEGFLLACEADARGRLGKQDTPYPQADYLRRAFDACRDIDARAFVSDGLQGPAIAEAMHEARAKAVAGVAKPNPNKPA